MNAAQHIDIDTAADTQPPTALETPMWLRAQNAESLLRDALRKIEGLEAANKLLVSVERAKCATKCDAIALEYESEGDGFGAAVAMVCADAIRSTP